MCARPAGAKWASHFYTAEPAISLPIFSGGQLSANLTLAQSQYEHGLATFIQVLDAERTVLADRQALVQADVQIVNDIVTLYRSLRGGWETTAAPSASVSL